MIIFDNTTREKIKEHNTNWLLITDHPYRLFIIEGSRFGEANALLNLISPQTGIDNIYLYAKDPFEAKKPIDNSQMKRCRLTKL